MKIGSIYFKKKNLENSFKRLVRRKKRERVNLIFQTGTSKTVDPKLIPWTPFLPFVVKITT